MSIRILFTFLLILSAFNLNAQEVDIRLYQKVPMRDGINLSANVYLPAERPEPLPVILIYTPYVNDEANDRGMYFARNGYVFISLDLRGRGNSEGEYAPFEKDGIDGYDAIEWISQQPWCNGKVGMMGGSYRGMVQWLTLKQKPKALVSMVPTASVGPGIDFPKSNGIFYNYALQWLTFTSGRSSNSNMFGNGTYWYSKALKKFHKKLPYNQWDDIALGTKNEIFQKWIAHPDFDEYWQGFYPTAEEYAGFDLPILTITGYFDGDQPGAMTYYKGHHAHASQSALDKHYLIFGPWSHAGTRNPVTELGGLKFGEDSKLNMRKLHREWFDWTMKGKEKPEFLKERVAIYMMKENEWQYDESYGALTSDTLTYYLSSPESEARNLHNQGKLINDLPGKEGPDQFVYDPLDTTLEASYTGPNFYLDPSAGYGDDKLVYISKPLEREMSLIGQMELGVYIELDVKDTDIIVAAYEKTALGETIYLGRDQLRARYRNGLETSELVTPGEINFYKFDDFYFTARKLSKGSRIMIEITHNNYPSTQKNYNSGKDVSTESGADAQVATVKLHHSKKYPSYLKLPVKK